MNINELKPLENNPFKSRGDDQIKLISKSIEDFQKMLSIRKIVIDENNEILGGNKRYFALKMLGYKDVPDEWIDKRTDLTEEEKKRFIVTDNAHYGSTWDNEMLKEWGATAEWGVDLAEWDKKLEAVEDDFDATPPEKPKTVLGDLYEIGEHRLLCGDSTCSDTVAKLMNGEKADMVFTDPPYGVSFVGIKGTMYQNGKKKGKDSNEAIKNDNLAGEDLSNLFYDSISNSLIFTTNNCPYYLFFAINKSKETIEGLEGLSLEIRNWLIWDKGNVGFHAMGAQYKPNYESFLYCFKNNNPPEWVGNQQQQTIWRHSTERLGLHPTMKPISLITQAIQNHIVNTVLDLFLGSGSTMVASHQLKRKCYGMELDPKYCDVIVNRMIKLDPTLTIKLNGVDVTKDWK